MSKHEFHFFANYIENKWSIDDADEIHHIQKVLRLQTGQKVTLSDGQGFWAKASIESMSKSSIEFLVEDTRRRESFNTKSLAFGALRPGDVDDVLPMLVELGIQHIHVLYQSETSKSRINDAAKARWQRILISSFKQSKAVYLPSIEVWADFQAFMKSTSAKARYLYVLDGDGTPFVDSLSKDGGSFTALVGGERGLNQEELKTALAAGFVKVSLGSLVLRAKTAIVGAAIMLSQCGDCVAHTE
jgi:16S rRNA (uracil1498-N3)-methyltransferase